jgi:hypothetical protein
MEGLQELQKLLTSPQYDIDLFPICFNLSYASSISKMEMVMELYILWQL